MKMYNKEYTDNYSVYTQTNFAFSLSQDGAKQIQGIQELVKGCSYIPMIVDSHDNLYLASPKKGLVKCIAM